MLRSRWLSSVVAVSLACAAQVSSLAGCKSSEQVAADYYEMVRSTDEQAIRDGIDAEMGRMCAPGPEELTNIASTLDASAKESLATYGSTPEELCEHLLARLDYTIDEIEVDGDHARAVLTVRNVDLTKALATSNASLVAGDGSKRLVDGYAQGTEMALMRSAMDVIYTVIDTTHDLAEATVECELTKQDNVWMLDGESNQRLLESALGGLAIEGGD